MPGAQIESEPECRLVVEVGFGSTLTQRLVLSLKQVYWLALALVWVTVVVEVVVRFGTWVGIGVRVGTIVEVRVGIGTGIRVGLGGTSSQAGSQSV